MKTFLGKLPGAFAILLSVAVVSQGSAYALAGAEVTGSGTISPGLTLTPTNQDFTFSTIIAVGVNTKPAAAAGQFSCWFAGSSQGGENLFSGQGIGSGTCTGAINVLCSIAYVRTGAYVIVTGSCSFGGGVFQSLDVVFLFVPTFPLGPPVTSYVVAGGAALL